MTQYVSRRAMLALLGGVPAYAWTFAWAADSQEGWRWCRKCQGLWFGGNTTAGACPAGGGHEQVGSGNYRLVHNSPGAAGQHAWRWCRKCQGLWFSGGAGRSSCPAGGEHTAQGSGNYALVSDTGQRNWRWCNKCQGLWLAGAGNEGACAAGGAHSQSGSGNYGLTISEGPIPVAVPDDLLGIWSAEERTKGGLGAQFAFQKGGAVVFTFGALVDFKYEINGNRLVTQVADPAGSEQTEEVFAIEGDSLMFSTKTPEGVPNTRTLTRVGTAYPNCHPIVGEWTGPGVAGKPAIMRYSRNGGGQLRMPFQFASGTYRNGSPQRIEFGTPGSGVALRRDGELLITTNAAGKEQTFRKFEY